MVPACQNGLLVAALGSNSNTDVPYSQWSPTDTNVAPGANELGTALAQALSLTLAAEQREYAPSHGWKRANRALDFALRSSHGAAVVSNT